jgi:hypothetical protein
MTDESAFQNSLDDLAKQIWPRAGAFHPTSEMLDGYAGLCAVFADWLEEQGDSRAAGYRWLCRHGKLPRRSNNSWEWWQYGDRVDSAPEDLPAAIWDRLPGMRDRQVSGNAKSTPLAATQRPHYVRRFFFSNRTTKL